MTRGVLTNFGVNKQLNDTWQIHINSLGHMVLKHKLGLNLGT
jgi:hypothetical protein